MHVRKTLVPLFIGLLVLALSACGELAPPGRETNLANTEWALVSFGPENSETPVVAGSSVTLKFEAEGRAGGAGGCNSYGGEYRVEGASVSFDQIVSTAMACADESVMEQEQAYFAALQTTGHFEIQNDRLIITYDEGRSALTFEKVANASL